jgi:glycosyltransferase involved in cell wall biosynthesis
MKVSICIFTFNHEKYIAEAIDSVLSQVTNFDYEIVIGEDCSSDRTRKIVERYQKQFHERIRTFFNEQNKGIMVNNSQTIMRCESEYIALLDGDDYWIDNQKLQRQVDFLDNNPNFGFCFHDGKILKIDGAFDTATCCQDINKTEINFSDIICNVSIPTFSILFRRKALVGYPPPWFSSLDAPDRPLFLLLSSQGPGFYFNECWGVYRKHSTGHWTGRNYESQWMTHLKIYEVINQHFEGIYNKEFCKCEHKVCMILAMQLLEDRKFRKSFAFFKRYLKGNDLKTLTLKGCLEIIRYILFFFKKKLKI